MLQSTSARTHTPTPTMQEDSPPLELIGSDNDDVGFVIGVFNDEGLLELGGGGGGDGDGDDGQGMGRDDIMGGDLLTPSPRHVRRVLFPLSPRGDEAINWQEGNIEDITDDDVVGDEENIGDFLLPSPIQRVARGGGSFMDDTLPSESESGSPLERMPRPGILPDAEFHSHPTRHDKENLLNAAAMPHSLRAWQTAQRQFLADALYVYEVVTDEDGVFTPESTAFVQDELDFQLEHMSQAARTVKLISQAHNRATLVEAAEPLAQTGRPEHQPGAITMARKAEYMQSVRSVFAYHQAMSLYLGQVVLGMERMPVAYEAAAAVFERTKKPMRRRPGGISRVGGGGGTPNSQRIRRRRHRHRRKPRRRRKKDYAFLRLDKLDFGAPITGPTASATTITYRCVDCGHMEHRVE